MKIILATDGSKYSRAAVLEGCRIISDADQTIVRIISVVDVPGAMGTEPFAISADYYREVEENERKTARGFVKDAEDVLRNCFADTDIKIEKIILKGPAGRMIIEEAEEWGADLILIGSHGYGFWNRVLLGSVSQKVAQNAPCSVLVVRGDVE